MTAPVRPRPLALYPGCSLLSTGRSYLDSIREVARTLEIPIRSLDDWNCCGATSGHFIDPDLGLLLPARNLELAERQGVDILTACAACHHRLADAGHALATSEAARQKAERSGISYRGNVRVLHLLGLLDPALVGRSVRRPLSGLRVACYYGCLLVRNPRAGGLDDAEAPVVMDCLMEACGAVSVAWQGKAWCCGGSLAAPDPGLADGLMERVLGEARSSGADCIASACPLCQLNLELHQERQSGGGRPGSRLPVVFFTQLVALALGADPRRLGLERHIVDARAVAAAAAGSGLRG